MSSIASDVADSKKQFMQQRMRDNTDVEMAPIRKAVRK